MHHFYESMPTLWITLENAVNSISLKPECSAQKVYKKTQN